MTEYLDIYYNPNLASLDGTFPNLQIVGGHIDIDTNPLLFSIGSAFGNLQSVGGDLRWYDNAGQPTTASTAGSRSFCASARGTLCATTTSYFEAGNADDAHECCTATPGATVAPTGTPPTAAPTTTPSVSPTSLAGTCLGLSISSDAELAAAVPAYRTCVTMTGTLNFRGGGIHGPSISNTTLLAEAFQNLRVVTGSFSIDSNHRLYSLDGTFQNLRTVGEDFYIDTNPDLTSIGSAFGNLQSVGRVMAWYDNGGSFCASARGVLCPITTSYRDSGQAGGVVGCCTAYCLFTEC